MARFGNDDTDYAFQVIGIIFIGIFALKLLIRIISLCQPFRRNILKRYGKGSYVLITGASDGIGKQFCFEFASLGFNIVLLSRNRTKLEAVENEIRHRFPRTDTVIVVADLAKGYDLKMYDQIADDIKGIDISILINNAGLMCLGPLLDGGSPEELNNMAIVNTLPVVHLTYKILPLLLRRREHKSAVITMSSQAAVKPTSFMAVYSATKAFVDSFSQSVEWEYPNVDFLAARPGFVNSNMVSRKPGLDTLTTEQCAKCLINDLGIKSTSFGNWRHQITGYFYGFVPYCLYATVWVKFLSKNILKTMK